MITRIFEDGIEITVRENDQVEDIIIVNGKKYKVVKKENPSYDSYYIGGDRGIRYFFGFEEVTE